MDLELLQQLAGVFIATSAGLFAVTEYVKNTFDLQDKKIVNLVTFVIGIIFAGGIYAGQIFPQAAEYITGAYFIVFGGMAAAGFYEFANARLPRQD